MYPSAVRKSPRRFQNPWRIFSLGVSEGMRPESGCVESKSSSITKGGGEDCHEGRREMDVRLADRENAKLCDTGDWLDDCLLEEDREIEDLEEWREEGREVLGDVTDKQENDCRDTGLSVEKMEEEERNEEREETLRGYIPTDMNGASS